MVHVRPLLQWTSVLALLLMARIVRADESLGDMPGDSMCSSINGDMFLNRCFIQYPSGFWTILAGLIQQWVNPRFLAQATMVLVLALPFLFMSFGLSVSSDNVRKYRAARIALLNFLHRVGYSLILDVALYAAFRQHRPCSCPSGGGYVQVGSIYGMPSGDAMGAAILAAWMVERGPVHRVWGRVVGVLVVAWVCMERVVLGYHSIGQVTTGAVMGIALHLYSTSVPQFMIFVDNFVQLIAGLLLLFLDPALVFAVDDSNNLFAWFFWGLAVQMFTVTLISRHYYTEGAALLRRSYRFLLHKYDSGEGEALLVNDTATSAAAEPGPHLLARLDVWWLWIAFAISLVGMLFSNIIQHYSFMAGR